MTVLVLGATGKTGRPLVSELAARGVPVHAAVRHPERVTELAGVEPVRFDWADRATWPGALAGVDAMYLVGPFGSADPVGDLADLLAAATDVRRVVLLSLIGAEKLPDVTPIDAWERSVRESGKRWTILRPNWFQQNFDGAFAARLRDAGTVTVPAADAAISFVDTRDIAAVAAIALTEDGHDGATYVLTGPEALTYGGAVAVLGAAADRPLRYEAEERDVFAGRMRAAGLAESAIRWQFGLYDLILAGENAVVTDTVEELTGRPARPLTDYAVEHARDWDTPVAVSR